MSSLWVDTDRCTLCGACLEACPFEAVEMTEDGPEANANCTLCGACVKACPEDALSVPDAAGAGEPTGEWSGIWVMAEERGGRLHHSTGELVGAAARLAPVRECSLQVVALGGELDHIPGELAGWPVDEVLLAEDTRLEDRTAEHWAATLAHLVESERPETILAPATALWRAVLPRAASVLHTGLTADCTGLDVSGRTGHLRQTRPAFGGDVMATITCPGHRPEMATVRPGVMSVPERDGSDEPTVRRVPPHGEAFQAGTHLLEVRRDEEEAVNIAEASVIVAGGGAAWAGRTALTCSGRPQRSWAARWRRADRPSMRAGCPTRGRWARRERPCSRSSTWHAASAAACSTASACSPPTSSWPSTPTPMRQSSR